ncbi:MAG: oligosaccharide flippase family protein [Candidatus Yanofskybacteria bacterium]|nr:oligosaccharide flippase family protein [Candidatus Yanofskybacteria bacterium]
MLKEKVRQFLQRLATIIKIDTLYLARGGFWNTFTFGITSLLSIALVWAFANLIPKETYGTYKYVMSIAGSLSFLALTGINTALTQATAQGQKGLLRYAIKIQLRWNLIMGVALVGVAGYYYTHNNIVIAASLLLLAIVTPLIATFNTYSSYLIGKKLFRVMAYYASLTSIFYTAVMVGILLLTDNIVAIVAAYCIANLVPLIFFYLRTLHNSDEEQRNPAPEQKRDLLHFLKHLSVMNVFSNLSQYVDKITVFHYIGAIELAVYGVALAIPDRIRGYFKTLTALVVPKVSLKTIPELRASFYLRVFQAFLIGIAASTAYFLIAPFIFHLLLPRYLDAIRYSQALGLVYIFVLPGSYVGEIFRAHKMIRALYLSSVTAHVSRIVLFVVLGIVWGVWGVIIASLGVHFLGLLLNFVLWEIESRKLLALDLNK